MKRVILIGGQLATGKSTLAKNLSASLNIPYFYKDVLKERLGDAIGFSNREENLRLSKGAYFMLYAISEQLISNAESFILESNFKQTELDELNKLFISNGYEVISFKLSGNLDILYRRYLHRFECENRSQVHANFNSFEEYRDYNLEIDKVHYPGKVFELDATKFIDTKDCISLLSK